MCIVFSVLRSAVRGNQKIPGSIRVELDYVSNAIASAFAWENDITSVVPRGSCFVVPPYALVILLYSRFSDSFVFAILRMKNL